MIERWMTSDPMRVPLDTTVAEARRVLSGFRHLPIVDGSLRGYLHATDLLEPDGAVGLDALELHEPRVVGPTTPMPIALQRLRGSSHDVLWVVDGDELTGVFTEHDAARYAAEILAPEVLVDDYASTGLTVIEPRTNVGEMRQMLERMWVRHLPVASGERLIGIVSWRDLVGADPHEAAGELVYWPAEQARWGDSLAEVARRMVAARIGAMPIVGDDGLLEGLVTRVDLIRACLSPSEIA